MRTLFGGALLIATVLLLWLDHSGWRTVVPAAEGSGLYQMFENGLIMALVVSLIVWLGLGEYGHIADNLGADIPLLLLTSAGAIIVLLEWGGWAANAGHFPLCPPWLRSPGMTVLLGLLITASTFMGWRVITGRIQKAGATMAHITMGLLYVMVPLGFIGAVRVHWDVNGVLVLLAVCKFTDIGAYYAGKFLGGPKLAPRVSPNKTWAGAMGGTIGAVTVAVVLSVMDWTFLSEGEAVVYALIMAAGAIVGDLCESVLKRESGIKDSGHLLPGSGGVLDVVDDVLFAAPFTYLYFSLLSG